jgi:hypothetical protein
MLWAFRFCEAALNLLSLEKGQLAVKFGFELLMDCLEIFHAEIQGLYDFKLLEIFHAEIPEAKPL